MTALSERVGLHFLPWMEKGECATSDPEVWFPSDELGIGPHEIKRQSRLARSLCGGCLVRQQCLNYAVANDERFGIWGGRDFGKARPRGGSTDL